MEAVNKIEVWHKTKLGHAIFGVVELAASYGFASWAITSGSLWAYLLTFIFVVGGIRNLVRIYKTHEQSSRTKPN